MNKRDIFLVLNVLVNLFTVSGVIGADPADIQELLHKSVEKRINLASSIVETKERIKFESRSRINSPMYNNSGVIHQQCEYRNDGTRSKVLFYIWGDVSAYDPDVSEEQAHYSSTLWDGENAYWYDRIGPEHPGSVTIRRSKDPGGVPKAEKQVTRGSNIVGEMMGYHWGDKGKRIDKVLERAESLELRQEKLRGVICYVIDAVVKGKGKYTLWIDPVHDYHIAKIHVRRKGGDQVNRIKLKRNDYTNEIYEITDFQQIEDSWRPKEYKVKRTTYHAKTGPLSINDNVINITNIALNPDHNALRSFMPDDIPNGASVRLLGLSSNAKFVWEDGKVVDANGEVILEPGKSQ